MGTVKNYALIALLESNLKAKTGVILAIRHEHLDTIQI